MNIIRYIFSLTYLFLQVFSSPGQDKKFTWHQANTGGGGYITGVVQDPRNTDILYARCDVGGVFKTTDKGKSWVTCNNGLTKWYSHSVQSIAIDPRNSNVIFRCSGDKRNNTLFGSVHKSTDGGLSWKEVLDKTGYYGNGETRMYGEVIAVDPFDKNNVITAGYTNGIWMSNDGGESWKYSTGKEETFLTVSIHPYRRNLYYATTQSGKLYTSTNLGKNWNVISSNPEFFITEIAFDKRKSNIVYCSGKGGVYRSRDSGKSFEKIMNGLPVHFQYNTIVSHPENTHILFTAPDARPDHPFSPIPIYTSSDGGDSWKKIPGHMGTKLNDYPAYIKSAMMAGWAISKVRIDLSGKNRFLFSNWYGVSFTEDGGETFSGKQFSGLETNCLENIQYDPGNLNTSYYTLPDHMPMVSRDDGQNYYPLPRTTYSSSTALVTSVHDSTVLLYGARDRHKNTGAIVRIHQGKSEVVFSFKDGYLQSIKEDPFHAGTFYCTIDGELNTIAGIYKSTDWGKSWIKLPFNLRPYMVTLPHEKPFIENELLNIVVGQKKNVCGTNKLLCIDPHHPNVLYFGEWTEGLFKSKDGGLTWEDLTHGLPFGNDTASVLSVIKADPKIAGRIYAGFIREGLWRSDDSGKSWKKIYPLKNELSNISDIHIGGTTGQDLFIGGETLYWSASPTGLWHSTDEGKTWNNIYDPSKGALRIKAIDVNRKSGTIVVGTSGNGAFYLLPK